jgi:hypothetical protein
MPGRGETIKKGLPVRVQATKVVRVLVRVNQIQANKPAARLLKSNPNQQTAVPTAAEVQTKMSSV